MCSKAWFKLLPAMLYESPLLLKMTHEILERTFKRRKTVWSKEDSYIYNFKQIFHNKLHAFFTELFLIFGRH